MIEDLKSSAIAFVYAWGIILVPIVIVSSLVTSTQVQEVDQNE